MSALPNNATLQAGHARGAIKLRVRDVNKSFQLPDKTVHVLERVDLEVRDGEFIAILGPSGCGKSTLLNIVGGFIQPSSGEVTIDGEQVNGPDPRRIFVFQERGVFPWLTVSGNIGFGLYNLHSQERKKRIAHYIE